MLEYIISIGFFLLLGVVAGVLLSVASKFLAVKTDERIEAINEALPNGNCGACGFSGCQAYAEAVAAGKAETNMCKPGGVAVAASISEIMGVKGAEFEPEVAFVHCNGNCNATKDKYEYAGTKSCAAVERYYNGRGSCKSGCSGLGDCVSVCENGAISVIDGVAVVNPVKCTGCGKCAKACPNHLITMRSIYQTVNIRCSANDKYRMTKSVCKNSCIACGTCVEKCPTGAIVIDDNHAIINEQHCINCGICIKNCPTQCIVKMPVCTAKK